MYCINKFLFNFASLWNVEIYLISPLCTLSFGCYGARQRGLTCFSWCKKNVRAAQQAKIEEGKKKQSNSTDRYNIRRICPEIVGFTRVWRSPRLFRVMRLGWCLGNYFSTSSAAINTFQRVWFTNAQVPEFVIRPHRTHLPPVNSLCVYKKKIHLY